MPPPQFFRPHDSHVALHHVAGLQSPRADLGCYPCQYHGKTCPNERAKKLNGERHRFCHEHRMRHNRSQRAYQKRKVTKCRPELVADDALCSIIFAATNVPLLPLCRPQPPPVRTMGDVDQSIDFVFGACDTEADLITLLVDEVLDDMTAFMPLCCDAPTGLIV